MEREIEGNTGVQEKPMMQALLEQQQMKVFTLCLKKENIDELNLI